MSNPFRTEIPFSDTHPNGSSTHVLLIDSFFPAAGMHEAPVYDMAEIPIIIAGPAGEHTSSFKFSRCFSLCKNSCTHDAADCIRIDS